MRGSGYSICQTFADVSVMAKQASQQRGEMTCGPLAPLVSKAQGINKRTSICLWPMRS